MSTITVTDLPPGTPATSAGVNQTLSSFNAGTAAGSFVAKNVRLEGIDRRTMSGTGHVVFTTEIGTNTPVSSTGTSGLVRSTGAWSVVNPGTALVTNSVTIVVTHRTILSASVAFTGQYGAAAAPRLYLELVLQQSVDAGVTFTSIIGTHQGFQLRQVGATLSGPGAEIPSLSGCATWSTTITPTGTPTLYRVAFQTTNDASTGGQDINFLDGTIFLEILGA